MSESGCRLRDMEEVAEFIGGEWDGRTVAVTDPPPHVIRVPAPANFVVADLVNAPPSAIMPTFRVDDYELIGRNDAGHLRYMATRERARIATTRTE